MADSATITSNVADGSSTTGNVVDGVSITSTVNESTTVTASVVTGGSDIVQSVNTYTGAVVLDPDDLDDTSTTNKFVTAADITNLGNLSGTNTGDQDLSTYQLKPTEGAFANGDKTKLDGIEALADVTDTTTVTAAGALMDSELTDIASVKALNQGVATTDSPSFAGLTTTGNINVTGNIVQSSSSGDALILNGTGTNNTLLRFKDDGTERGAIFSLNGNGSFYVRSQGTLSLGSAGVTGRIFVDTSGNVGVNETSPSDRLDIVVDDTDNVAGLGITQNDTTNNPKGITVTNAGTGDGLFIDHNNSGKAINIDMDANSASSATGLHVNVANAGAGGAYAAVFEAGNVGIGTASPANNIHLYQDTTDTGNTTGMTIEQDGTGDAALQFLLTGVKRWMIGVDNSDSDSFKISPTSALGTSDALTVTTAGNVGIGTTAPTEILDVNGDAIRIRTSQTPASASATGTAGMVCWDASYIYVCTATNQWRRIAHATW